MRRGLLKRLAYKTSTFFGLTLLIFSGLSFNLAISHADDLSISTPTNCDSNAVIYCGATSVSSLIDKYTNGDGANSVQSIHDIYSFFGITKADINGMDGSVSGETVQKGTVDKAGNVYDSNGKLLANTAITAGRDLMANSVYDTYDNTHFYARTPSVSFLSNSLDAYVVTINGKFAYAILASCGNPVMATPVVTPTSKPKLTPTSIPKPTTAAPKPTPASTTTTTTTTNQTNNVNYCSGNTTNLDYDGIATQGGNCSTNNTVVVAAPAQQPTPFGQCTGLSLDIVQTSPLEVSVTANDNTANGAQLTSVVYNFGDSTPSTAPSTQLTQTHTYATAGNYTITATLGFIANGQPISNATCQATVNSTAPPPTPTIVTTSSVTTTSSSKPAAALVNTGPGDVVALFGASSLIGMIGYRIFLGKRI